MDRNLARLPQFAFAIALIILGVQHFLFKDFIAGRAPAWPEGLFGKEIFAYITGALLIATGVAVALEKNAKSFLVVTGLTILAWAGLRNVVEVVTHPEYGGLLTNTMKALTMGAGAFVIGNSLGGEAKKTIENLVPNLAPLGRISLGLFFTVGGVQHFIFADFVKFLVPAWIPAPLFWTYFAGVALILAGISLIALIQIKLSSLLATIMVGTWLFVLHIPRAIDINDQNEWTAVCEALSVTCFSFTIYLQKRESAINRQAIIAQ